MGLFRRKSPEGVQRKEITKILFTSDIHGSDVVYRKLLNAGKIYKVDTIIVGGDIAGKRLIPCVEIEPGKLSVMGRMVGREGLKRAEDEIRATGDYYVELNERDHKMISEDGKLVAEIFKEQTVKRLREWMELAEERYAGTGIPIYMNLGNARMKFILTLFLQ